MTWRGRIGEQETPRHLFILAAQCPHAGRLDRLEAAAHALHDVLTDPALGRCTPFPDGRTLLTGDDVTVEQVRTALDGAITAAARDGAVLVLAFLGHGHVPEHSSRLYYRTGDIPDGQLARAIDVGEWIGRAANTPNVSGVVALVDTCHAGGAAHALSELSGGLRTGKTRASILASCGVDQPSYGLSFTTALVEDLRRGRAGDAEHVYPDTALTHRLREAVPGQDVVNALYDADPHVGHDLWLARNPRCGRRALADVVGEIAHEDLHRALEAWLPAGAPAAPRTRRDLSRLRESLEAATAAAAASAGVPEQPAAIPGLDPAAALAEVEQVLMIVDECVATVEFLDGWLGWSLDTDVLRAAAEVARIPAPRGFEGSRLLRWLVEYAALRAPVLGENGWAALARLVAALVRETGGDVRDQRLLGWAGRLNVATDLGAALPGLEESRQLRDTRLIISLDDTRTDWPERIHAWLVRRDAAHTPRESFACASADRGGIEGAIGRALVWAHREAGPHGRFTHIDIAAPAHLLAQWYPEESYVGRHYLGAKYDVATRWSGRLQPDDQGGDINALAVRQLGLMDAAGGGGEGAPVDWIGPEAARDISTLTECLREGVYERAIGIDHGVPDLAGLLELVLPYTPIVLWPRSGHEHEHGLEHGHEHGHAHGLARGYGPEHGTEHGHGSERRHGPKHAQVRPAHGHGPPAAARNGSARTARQLVDEHWPVLPHAFPEAYRLWRRARAAGTAAPAPLAELAAVRAAWHDKVWLEFCRWFEYRKVVSPEESS